MSEGCKWHRNRLGSETSKKWVVPPFELKDTDGDGDSGAPVAPVPPGVEFVPTYDGQKWSLQQCGICKPCRPCRVVTEKECMEITTEAARLEADMKEATQRFLDGLDSDDESDDGAEFGFEFQ